MSIELTIKYTEDEYLSAVKEKLEVMPNRRLHTYAPFLVFCIVVFGLWQIEKIDTWWGLLITILLGVYAIPCLFSDWLMPKIALIAARKKKLSDTYHFVIDDQGIVRQSEQGSLKFEWRDVPSVDFFPNNVFINLERGSVLIPVSRLSSTDLALLKQYAM